ncbi:AAA domain-containing protein [Apiospora arundinis]
MSRTQPNIIVTGTPGVGKTTHCEMLAERTGLRHVSVNHIVKDKECHEGWDDEFGCWIVDEDKLLDAMEDEAKAGGCIIDWHACDLFPRELDRSRRGAAGGLQYPLRPAVSTENIDSEIMQVLLQEARDSYDEEMVVELQSNTSDEMDSNVDRIEQWVTQWRKDNAEEGASA